MPVSALKVLCDECGIDWNVKIRLTTRKAGFIQELRLFYKMDEAKSKAGIVVRERRPTADASEGGNMLIDKDRELKAVLDLPDSSMTSDLRNALSAFPHRSDRYRYTFKQASTKSASLTNIKLCGLQCRHTGCVEITYIGVGHCKAHLAQDMKLRVCRSRKNNGNAGITIEAWSPESCVTASGLTFKPAEFICWYDGLWLESNVITELYGTDTAEFGMENTVRRADGTGFGFHDLLDDEDLSECRLLYTDAALLRSLGALCNECDPGDTPTADIVLDEDTSLWKIIAGPKGVRTGVEVSIDYTRRREFIARRRASNYRHGGNCGKTTGYEPCDYPWSGEMETEVAGVASCAQAPSCCPSLGTELQSESVSNRDLTANVIVSEATAMDPISSCSTSSPTVTVFRAGSARFGTHLRDTRSLAEVTSAVIVSGAGTNGAGSNWLTDVGRALVKNGKSGSKNKVSSKQRASCAAVKQYAANAAAEEKVARSRSSSKINVTGGHFSDWFANGGKADMAVGGEAGCQLSNGSPSIQPKARMSANGCDGLADERSGAKGRAEEQPNADLKHNIVFSILEEAVVGQTPTAMVAAGNAECSSRSVLARPVVRSAPSEPGKAVRAVMSECRVRLEVRSWMADKNTDSKFWNSRDILRAELNSRHSMVAVDGRTDKAGGNGDMGRLSSIADNKTSRSEGTQTGNEVTLCAGTSGDEVPEPESGGEARVDGHVRVDSTVQTVFSILEEHSECRSHSASAAL